MKNAIVTLRRGYRYPLAALAGLLLAAAFPNIGIAGLAWVAPAVMVSAALGQAGKEVFRLGYVSGLTYYLAGLYWLLLIPYRWHSIPVGPMAGWLGLSAFVGLYPALWVWFMVEPGGSSGAAEPRGLFADRWLSRLWWAFSGAAVWVGLEMILARFLSGFPWNLLGTSQYRLVPLIQIASFAGVYGVSFLVVWFSLSLLSGFTQLVRRPSGRSVWLGEIMIPTLVLALLFNMGLRKFERGAEGKGRTLRATLIQPSIPQTLIWDSNQDDERFRELIELSRQALTNQTDLLVWPEAAVPKLLRYDKEIFAAVTGLARDHHVWMIVGSDDAEPRGDGNSKEADYYNSSFLINPEGKLVERYRKRNLVIFGEYVPLVDWFPFMKWFTPVDQGYRSGERNVPFELTNLHEKTSVLICYEDLFPHLARGSVDPDTDFLVNLTNNGWFGEGAAQWQHAIGAVFRAAENGVPLLRCSNNGLTCWIDERGTLRELFRDPKGTIYGAGFMLAQVPLPPAGTRAQTFYNRHGDWFGWGCVGVAMIKLGLRVWRWRKGRI